MGDMKLFYFRTCNVWKVYQQVSKRASEEARERGSARARNVLASKREQVSSRAFECYHRRWSEEWV